LINVGGKLYGTTSEGGGAYGQGTVFAIDPKVGVATVVHSFPANGKDGFGPTAGLINVNGSLFGTTTWGGKHVRGTVFSIDPTTGAETVVYSFCRRLHCADGAGPGADLLNVKGTLYGTTNGGGDYGHGTVFSFDLNTGTETVLYSFDGIHGDWPAAALIKTNGKLFGTTTGGGKGGHWPTHSDCPQNGCGTVFSIKP
jgi:uncharacterized repeat protein (TIGR03803 family)